MWKNYNRTKLKQPNNRNQQDTHSAEVIVAGTLAIELASTEVDVGGAVAVNPRLRDEASRASIAGVESNRLENREHFELFPGSGRYFNRPQAANSLKYFLF